MKESLAECVRGIRAGIDVAEDAILKKDWARASNATRQVLSFSGKLNQRLGVLTDFLEEAILEAKAAAAVDRALAPIPGQTSIDELLKPSATKDRKPSPARKQGGKGGR